MMVLSHLLQDIVTTDCKFNPEIHEITQDSRTVKPQGLFFAYPGLQHDGRDFIKSALEKSAAAILYESGGGYQLPPQFAKLAFPFIPVLDLNKKVGFLADRFYQHPTQHMPVIGVTGTNGKTSISHFLAQAFQKLERRCAIIGTIGSGFLFDLKDSGYTTPDSIALQKQLFQLSRQEADLVAMEISSHSLEQYRVNGVNFLGAIFTNLTRDHLDYHKTMEAYGAAKARLFQFPHLKFAVYNADDLFGHQLFSLNQHNVPAFWYSTDANFDAKGAIVAKSIQPNQLGFEVSVKTPWGSGTFYSPLIGRFNVSNVLAVLATLGALEIPLQNILDILSELKPVAGRMQCLGGQGNFPKIIIDYAHTPDALEKTLLSLQDHRSRQLWCVFGCGGDRDRGKRPEMGRIAENYCDQIILTNDNPRHESPQQIVIDIQSGINAKNKVKIELDRAKAIQYAIENASAEDVILIAGKGHETTQTFRDQVLPFSDRKVVEDLLD